MEVFEAASEWFWNPEFWLPVNFTWEDIQPTEEFKYPNTKDVYIYPIILAIFLIVLNNFICIPYFFLPFANSFNLNCRRVPQPTRNKHLESLYIKYGIHVPKILKQRAADKLKWRSNEVEKWFYQKKQCKVLPKGEKFAKACFTMFLHLVCFVYGLYVLHDKIWFHDIIHCWEGYPYHEVDDQIWNYYILILATYWKIALDSVMDPTSGKDQIALYIHHTFTILLICFSWTLNFIRVGSLVMVLHEAADWIVLIAKLGNYVKNEVVTGIFLAITIVVFFLTRLCIYPFYLMKSAFFVGPTYMFMPSAYLFIFLMIGLLLLNVMWMTMMLIVVVRKIKSGKLEDIRSSEESAFENSDSEENVMPNENKITQHFKKKKQQ